MTLLEKLAPYLPYELEMCFIVRDEIVRKGILNNISINSSETHPVRLSIDSLNELEHEWMFKPILRPLSDLYKNEFIYLKQELDGVYTSGYVNHLIAIEVSFCTLSYYYVSLLLQNHFDVFGMIEDGLAIDINTLK